MLYFEQPRVENMEANKRYILKLILYLVLIHKMYAKGNKPM